MNDQALLSHAARVIDQTPADGRVDAALRHYLAGPRPTYPLHPREKRAITKAVFAFFRWIGWTSPSEKTPVRVRRALDLQERFDRDPTSVKVEALAVRAVPEWLAGEMEIRPDYLRQLQREPALWIRARMGQPPAAAQAAAAKAGQPFVRIGARAGTPAAAQGAAPEGDRPAVGAGLSARAARAVRALAEAEQLGHPVPAALPEGWTGAGDLAALRCTGAPDLFRTALFHAGAFEIQDLASQLVGLACNPRRGENWWDVCAGEGGKTLHLADLMENTGVVWATDRSTARIEVLRRRAARAGVFNYRAALWDGTGRAPTSTRFDGILVDAPCSGVGTWGRNPHARWTVTAQDVKELAAVQLGLLNRVASSVKPGGRLIYSVCTLTRTETEGVAGAFGAAHPQFEPVATALTAPASAAPSAPAAAPAPPADGSPAPGPDSAPAAGRALEVPGSRLWLRPEDLSANGMFVAAWRRKP